MIWTFFVWNRNSEFLPTHNIWIGLSICLLIINRFYKFKGQLLKRGYQLRILVIFENIEYWIIEKICHIRASVIWIVSHWTEDSWFCHRICTSFYQWFFYWNHLFDNKDSFCSKGYNPSKTGWMISEKTLIDISAQTRKYCSEPLGCYSAQEAKITKIHFLMWIGFNGRLQKYKTYLKVWINSSQSDGKINCLRFGGSQFIFLWFWILKVWINSSRSDGKIKCLWFNGSQFILLKPEYIFANKIAIRYCIYFIQRARHD